MIKPAHFCNKCYTDQVKTFQQNNKSNNSRLNHTLFIYTNYHLITVHTTKLTSRENTRSSITTCVLKCHYLHVFNQHQLNSILLILLTFPRLTTVPLAYFDTVGTRENCHYNRWFWCTIFSLDLLWSTKTVTISGQHCTLSTSSALLHIRSSRASNILSRVSHCNCSLTPHPASEQRKLISACPRLNIVCLLVSRELQPPSSFYCRF